MGTAGGKNLGGDGTTTSQENKDSQPLIVPPNQFEVSSNQVIQNLDSIRVDLLINGYFRINDKYNNPTELVNIVKEYYGSGVTIISCKSAHKSQILLINIPININTNNTKHNNIRILFKYYKTYC